MTDPAFLAASLGNPVANGLLAIESAQAAIAAATARGMRDGMLYGPGTLDERLAIYNHILALNVRKQETRRESIAGTIKRILKPMILSHRPWNELMAEAHQVNGGEGFPLREQEVSDLVEIEVWYSLPHPPVRRHGRG